MDEEALLKRYAKLRGSSIEEARKKIDRIHNRTRVPKVEILKLLIELHEAK